MKTKTTTALLSTFEEAKEKYRRWLVEVVEAPCI
jgi:hypothetical protein